MIKTFYKESYYAQTPTQSMRKLRPVAEGAAAGGLAMLSSDFDTDGLVPRLKRLHNPAYVQAFMDGKEPLCSTQGWSWTPEIRDGVLAINAGMLAAAKTAMDEGVAANVAQGFHHSGYERGCGFCTFNGLALVAQENPQWRVAVLDCDEHGGNGTEEFTELLPNLFQVTIHGSSFGCRGGDRSVLHRLGEVTHDYGLYERALEDAAKRIKAWRPDLVIYQAGADPHIDDPLNTLGMTSEQMRARDRFAFEFCKKAGLPVFFVLAGGYQRMEPLVRLHLQTFEEANKVYNK